MPCVTDQGAQLCSNDPQDSALRTHVSGLIKFMQACAWDCCQPAMTQTSKCPNKTPKIGEHSCVDRMRLPEKKNTGMQAGTRKKNSGVQACTKKKTGMQSCPREKNAGMQACTMPLLPCASPVP